VELKPSLNPAQQWAAIVFRWACLLYLSLILCPIRYGAPTRSTVDNTWFFALNYAAAHHLHFGRDIVWTWGPFAYLLIPFHIGSNLIQGLAFQTVLWLFLIVVLWDVLVFARFPTINIALFSAFLALSSINYAQDLYPSYLLPPLALLLLVHFRLHGSIARLLAALFLLGLLPLFQFVGVLAASGIVLGFIADRFIQRSPRFILESALAAFLPAFITLLGGIIALSSLANFFKYIRSSNELASGYVFAMSLPGTPAQTELSLLAFALLAGILVLLFFLDRRYGQFFALILAVPLIFELRHGLVRQDFAHVTQLFSFIALAFAVIALSIPFRRWFVTTAGVVVFFSFFALCWNATITGDLPRAIAALDGTKTARILWKASHYHSLVQSLQAAALQNSAEFGLDPEMRTIVGQESVAFLSHVYSSALGDGLNLALLPVLQNYSAYTPYLDQLNADWINSRGPHFLIFEAIIIDDRQPWTEAPATWAAAYRWYDTRKLGEQYLLLERRSQPRFTNFQQIESRTVSLREPIFLPQSNASLFWSMRCNLNSSGVLRALLFRVPEVTMTVTLQNRASRSVRAILPVLTTPSPGNYLPFGLSQVAQVFDSAATPAFPPRQTLQFGGPGAASYRQTCQLEFWRTSPSTGFVQ
jgi:hypothetical protein